MICSDHAHSQLSAVQPVSKAFSSVLVAYVKVHDIVQYKRMGNTIIEHINRNFIGMEIECCSRFFDANLHLMRIVQFAINNSAEIMILMFIYLMNTSSIFLYFTHPQMRARMCLYIIYYILYIKCFLKLSGV